MHMCNLNTEIGGKRKKESFLLNFQNIYIFFRKNDLLLPFAFLLGVFEVVGGIESVNVSFVGAKSPTNLNF